MSLREQLLIRSSQVPTSNEDKAVAFVQGLVPSAVVTQRHMGALSFNAPQLQVKMLSCIEQAVLQPAIMPAHTDACGCRNAHRPCNYQLYFCTLSG